METIARQCAVCGSGLATLAYDQPTHNIVGIGDVGYHHRIRVCDRCGFVYASPLLPENVILKYYEAMSNYEHPESGGIRPDADVRQVERQLEIIKSRFPSGFKGRALDVGCSIAYGLSLLQKDGWEVLGLDPSDRCIELSKAKLGVNVRKGVFPADGLADGGPFDLILISHVLEHVVHPDRMLRAVRGLLSDNGLAYIEVPNLMRPNGTKCYFGFEHVNFFTPTSLENLARQNGLEVDSISTFENGKAIHPFYPVIAATFRRTATRAAWADDRNKALGAIEVYKAETDAILQNIRRRVGAAIDATRPGRLALWGAGIHTSQLLSETSLSSAHIGCIYDNDPKKTGSKLAGIEVRAFPSSAALVQAEVDAILISSEASEDAIYRQLAPLANQGIRIFCLYSDR